MSFAEVMETYAGLDMPKVIHENQSQDVLRALGKSRLGPEDLLALLSPAAGVMLEELPARPPP